MKNLSYILIGLSLLIFIVSSCEMRDELKKLPAKEEQKNNGYMTLDMVSPVKSKAIFDQNDIDPTLYTVDIVDAITNASVRHYDSYADLQREGQIKLLAGKYKVVAYNYEGSGVNASERPYFKGVTEFEILPGKTTKVNTTCKLQNIAVTIAFKSDFKQQFKDDYAITVTNGDGGVKVYDKKDEGKTFYFKVPVQKNSVLLTVKATTNTNNQIAQNYTVIKPVDAEGNDKLVSGDEFTVSIGAGDEPSIDPTTQIKLNMAVDLTMHETGLMVEVPTENIVFNPGGGGNPDPDPEPDPDETTIRVTGLPAAYQFSVSETAVDETKYPTVQVNIIAPNGIKKLEVGIKSTNQEFDGSMDDLGLRLFDLTKPDELPEILFTTGLLEQGEIIAGKTSYLFDVSAFMQMLSLFEGGGIYTFSIKIGDGGDTEVTGDLVVTVTD